MRLLVHDYAGHPFQLQLSRALAARGHEVTHAYCASLSASPYAALEPRPDDPPGLTIRALRLTRPIDKFALWQRWRADVAYGRLLDAEVRRLRPDAVLSANTPLDAQRALLRATRSASGGRGRFVLWLQDLISEGAVRVLRRRSALAAATVGGHYRRMERRLLRASDAVVLITDDFRPPLRKLGVPDGRMHTIENWAPLDELPPRPRDNAWARSHGLDGKLCLLYSGTLGMKHNPRLLVALAERSRERADICITVISRGRAMDWLRRERDDRRLTNLLLLDFQPFEAMPDVLASADVLLAILEPDAGAFSVPSKVLTYLCAGRPTLLAVPGENLAAQTVRRAGAGLVVPPHDVDAFVREAQRLVDDPALRQRLGDAARAYAEQTFDIARIADRFEHLLTP